MTIGYIFPLPSPYTQAQLNWLAFEMWDRAARTASEIGRIHHRAIANAIGFASLETEPCAELTLHEWKTWRETCQRVKMEEVV